MDGHSHRVDKERVEEEEKQKRSYSPPSLPTSAGGSMAEIHCKLPATDHTDPSTTKPTSTHQPPSLPLDDDDTDDGSSEGSGAEKDAGLDDDGIVADMPGRRRHRAAGSKARRSDQDDEADESEEVDDDEDEEEGDGEEDEEEEEAPTSPADSTPRAGQEPSQRALQSLPLPLALAGNGDGDSPPHIAEFRRESHNRVKLYVLCDNRVWDDRGTGHVLCVQAPARAKGGPSTADISWWLVMRLEPPGAQPAGADNGDARPSEGEPKNLLESRVLSEIVYQRQQGTLIVWSENENCDLALSFQEKAGCSEVWDQICRIQGKDPNAEDSDDADDPEQQSDSSAASSGISLSCSATGGQLPPCTLQHLADVDQAIQASMYSPGEREKMAQALQYNNYLPKLVELFSMCEDVENVDALHTLYSVAKNLFLLNRTSLLSDLIDESHFKAVVGMLEWDPAAGSEPRRHREFLWERSQFREILPIASDELKSKIHETYRLQYVQDVCLPAPSLFEENLLSGLNSHLLFNRAEIVNYLMNDDALLKQLFDELKEPTLTEQRQHDLTIFLKEFCSFAHSLQNHQSGPVGRETFFKILISHDVLSCLDPCISSSFASTRATTVELLAMIVEFNPQHVRDYLMRQSRCTPESRNDSLLINKLIAHMLSDKDPEQTAAQQMQCTLRSLLDPETIVGGTGKSEGKMSSSSSSEFLQMFYKRAMQTLTKPVIENWDAGENRLLRDDYYTANRLSLVVELLCFLVDHHQFQMRMYTTQKNLLAAVLNYLKSRHHFLALCALRMLRRVVGSKESHYIDYVKQRRLLQQVVDCFTANGPRNNALNSALIEFFEYIRNEEIRPLMEQSVDDFWEDHFASVDYVRTFEQMRTRVEQMKHGRLQRSLSPCTPTTAGKALLGPNTPLSNAQWRKERDYESEELFFSTSGGGDSDDEEEDINNASDNRLQGKGSGGGGKDDDEKETATPNAGAGHYRPTGPQRKSGVDLFQPMPPMKRRRTGGDDDDEEEMASIFGGSGVAAHGGLPITPPISQSGSVSRLFSSSNKRIVIKMGGQVKRTIASSSSSITSSAANTTTTDSPRSAPSNAGDESESLLTSSSSTAATNVQWAESVTTTTSSSSITVIGAGPGESATTGRQERPTKLELVATSSSSTQHSNVRSSEHRGTPAATEQPLSGMEIAVSTANKCSGIILKRGLAGLVDYDESDSDEEDGTEQ